MKIERPEASAEQEADDLRELIANERLRHMDERIRLGEKVLEERRLRYEVEQEDAVALADMTAQRDALADAGHALGLLSLQSERYREDPDFRDAVDDMLAALRAAGRLP